MAGSKVSRAFGAIPHTQDPSRISPGRSVSPEAHDRPDTHGVVGVSSGGGDAMSYAELLGFVIERVRSAGVLLAAEWGHEEGPRGHGDKATVDVEIEAKLRSSLLALGPVIFGARRRGTV